MTRREQSRSFLEAREREIMERGGPTVPISFDELQRQAERAIEPRAFDYAAGGAGAEDTMRANRDAFRRYRILPRVLRDVSERDLSVELFGETLPAPVAVAPIGTHEKYHEEAELATARAASSLGVPLTLATASTKPLEEVAESMDETPAYFQLYWGEDWDATAELVDRAERAGYSALVVTVDSPLSRWRPRNLERAYSTLDDTPSATADAGTKDPSLTWDDLTFLRERTGLPIVLKGILHPHDAVTAVERGVDGLVVSNHGGRSVDGALGALDALPSVVEAVGGRVPVLFDSGIRGGADIFKAVALGATAVLVGRPYVYGLAIAGEQGVYEVLYNYLAELDSVLGMSGHTSIAELDEEALVESPIR
ncbi:MAG: alpha-hydroxy-acid oxidizing protein [Halobacteriota archaeon]